MPHCNGKFRVELIIQATHVPFRKYSALSSSKAKSVKPFGHPRDQGTADSGRCKPRLCFTSNFTYKALAVKWFISSDDFRCSYLTLFLKAVRIQIL